MKEYIKKIIQSIGANFSKNLIEHELKTKKSSPISRFFQEESEASYTHFKKYFSNSLLFRSEDNLSEENIRKFSIKKALLLKKEKKDSIFMEFGVYKGGSTRIFSEHMASTDKLYCFDSFEGLSHDWKGRSFTKGHFKLEKHLIPKFENNVELIIGLVEETLENLLKKINSKISFVHIDLDGYESTSFVLNKIKSRLLRGCILLFDQIHHVAGWRSEYKALTENFDEKEFEYIAFDENGRATIR